VENSNVLFRIVLIVLALVIALIILVRRNRRARGLESRWSAVLEFTPESIGGFSYRQLALVSAFGLFLEVLLIRWVSSEVRIFAYFKNLVLIASYLGFGLGCYLSRRAINLLVMLIPFSVLTILIGSPFTFVRIRVQSIALLLGATSDSQFWGVPALVATPQTLVAFFLAICACVLIFLLVAFVFIPVGQLVGWQLEKAPNGVAGYTVNVLASLFGIVLYTLVCFIYQPPLTWVAVAGGMLVLLLGHRPALRWSAAGVFAGCLLLLAMAGPAVPTHVFWSPYQKLTLTPDSPLNPTVYHLQTNDTWYQKIVNLSPEFVRTHPQQFQTPVEMNAYNVPYRFYAAPPKVLVLGAGMGNDVAAALRNGAEHVVAVEIDPLILKLGRQLHFEKPYDSPKVSIVVNDARNYVQNTRDQFDLIMFSLLDSHTTNSHYTNIRIDNYVYTVEAMMAARRLLKDDGIFVVKFQVNTPWIAGRLQALQTQVFGRDPIRLAVDSDENSTGGFFFVSGSPDRLRQAMVDPRLAAVVARSKVLSIEPAAVTTDDWPYFYQRKRGLPLNILAVSVALMIVCGGFIGKVTGGVRRVLWHFFFLGAGFMLLEAQIISKMALLFGTTWLVNSIVISGLLLLIVAANSVRLRGMQISYPLAYGGLFLALAVNWLIPVHLLLFKSMIATAVVATLVLCVPVFFAGCIFIRSFEEYGFSGEALGSNLFGALMGGLLESLSFWTGLKALVLIAAFLYAGSALGLTSRYGVRGKSAAAAAS
jgi:spermidine synthase